MLDEYEITMGLMDIWFNGVLQEARFLLPTYVSYNLLSVILVQVSNQCMALVNDKIIVPTKVQILLIFVPPVHILIKGCP